jgi:hypothetical protein
MNTMAGSEADLALVSGEGDFVVVDRVQSPTEAHIIRSCIESAGIAAELGDANTVQMNWIWTVALGGVRVLARASVAGQAREVVAMYHSGALTLEGESTEPAAVVPLEPGQALWNVDAAAVWSLWVTPLFGAVLQWLNARTLRDADMARASLQWVAVSAIATVFAMAHMLQRDASLASLQVASSLLSPLTCVWYIASGRDHSKRIIARHGRRYRKRFIAVALVPAVLLYYTPAMWG